MLLDPNNPWQVNVYGTICQTCDVGSRVDKIKASTDEAWLQRVVVWTDNQKTVQQAAERRLRKITKGVKR